MIPTQCVSGPIKLPLNNLSLSQVVNNRLQADFAQSWPTVEVNPERTWRALKTKAYAPFKAKISGSTNASFHGGEARHEKRAFTRRGLMIQKKRVSGYSAIGGAFGVTIYRASQRSKLTRENSRPTVLVRIKTIVTV